jgi:hypothetical protein
VELSDQTHSCCSVYSRDTSNSTPTVADYPLPCERERKRTINGLCKELKIGCFVWIAGGVRALFFLYIAESYAYQAALS